MLKRVLDFLFAATSLIVLAPVLLVVAVLVAVRLGRPVFFTQERPGRDGVPFRLIKFRTMASVPEGASEAEQDNMSRIMPFGAALREWSLDELPGLLNVLKGDMSLVGPRPLLMEYLPLYSPYEARRQEVRPGLTGWAQVNGRNTVDWDTKFALDVWYVDNRGLWLDLRILWMTALVVCRRQGINRDAGTTMPRFRGSARVTPPIVVAPRAGAPVEEDRTASRVEPLEARLERSNVS